MEASGVLGIVHDLAKDAKVSPELMNKHIGKLQESVGLLSGSMQDLSNKKLQDLSSQSQNPADFVAKFKEASSQGVSNLVPMMEILHGICRDDKTKAFYSKAKRPPPMTSSNDSSYRALKEKLLQQVGPLSVLDNQSAPQRSKRLFPERPYMTLDFLADEMLIKGNIGPLGKIPVISQESAIIEDLLYCFIGIEGSHIKPIKNASTGHVDLKLDPSMDPSLRELVQRIAPLCQHYSTIVQFAEDWFQQGSGRVNQALSGALYQIIKDYYIFVTQLEAQLRQHELTLNKLWFYIQPTLSTMAMVAEVCRNCETMGARGGKTLSLLHQLLMCQTGNENCKAVAEFLVKAAAKPYFEILSRWIHRGMISDSGKDFFVEDNEVIDRTILPLEYSDDYWERRYTLRMDQIPAFLHSSSDMILRTGKYLNVIQQCDKSIQWPESVDEVQYMPNPDQYRPLLEKAHAFASKTLLDLLVKDRDLIGHLRSVKHYFLLDQGDFIVQFMDLCEKELLQNVNQVEPARLESLLELAQRTSAANTDPYKDNVGVELLPYDLIFQMCKILSIDTDSEMDFKTPSNTSDLTGLEAFAFGYDVQWPISLVLNRKSLACYQMLLRQLFYCKHVERLLSSVWISTKVFKCYPTDQYSQYAASFALRQKMLNFLQNLEYYMTFEVLEPNWEAMITKIRSGKIENVDQVLEIHSDFLSSCLNDCMLSSPQLLTTVRKLLGVCVEFAGFMELVAQSCDELDTFHDEVAKFDLRFNSVLFSLLDRIAQMGRENYNERIMNILHRLDFNGFYTQALDQFGCTP